jgi:MmyB-like transcription regulator ligand binding domain
MPGQGSIQRYGLPAMRRLLDQLTQTPAVVLGRRLDILAWNASATALSGPGV